MAPTVKEIRDMREQQLEMNLQTNGLDPFSGSFQERQNRLIQFLHPSFEVMENIPFSCSTKSNNYYVREEKFSSFKS